MGEIADSQDLPNLDIGSSSSNAGHRSVVTKTKTTNISISEEGPRCDGSSF